MGFQKNSFTFFYFCFLFFLPSLYSVVIAYPTYSNNRLIEFSLSIESHKTYFDFPTKVHEVETDQARIIWYESFTRSFHGGLEFGYIEIIQPDNPLPSAQVSSGEFFGILLRFKPIDYPIASLTLNLNYRYNKTESVNNFPKSEFIWHEALFVTELDLHPFKYFGLILAAEYQDLSGTQRDFNNLPQITNFTEEKNIGFRAGINFKPDPNADIRLEWLTGYRNGARINFVRRF